MEQLIHQQKESQHDLHTSPASLPLGPFAFLKFSLKHYKLHAATCQLRTEVIWQRGTVNRAKKKVLLMTSDYGLNMVM